MIEGLGLDNDDAVFRTQTSGHHYFKIKLTFRKTNQGDATKCKNNLRLDSSFQRK